jgi:hypothetical protein
VANPRADRYDNEITDISFSAPIVRYVERYADAPPRRCPRTGRDGDPSNALHPLVGALA